MSILVNAKTRVICQGITGSAGAFHTRGCLDYGTKMVGGVTPGKGGTKDANGLPVFDTVHQAVDAAGADATMIFVPPPFAADAIMEAADAGIGTIVAITEGIPVLDMIAVRAYLKDKPKSVLIGPNCPGIISRSGTLTYEAVWQCSTRGIGQTTCVGIGGDPVKGLNFIELLDLFARDDETDGIILIGEIGGADEEAAASFVQKNVKKPVVAFIAGRTAPPGRRMGHAGAIISGGEGTAESKIAALKAANITVADSPATIGQTMAKVLGVTG